ncbi:chemotaxis protein CheW [Sulfobacillus thermosulfidooxidans]|uniref:hybrid sensor histidine kinase/response regulator n=1 Tax=Sulfobacillus thermosulfidooxidans TaxID=28034 RepID=UPI00041095A6|nr:chemotaxis protein CheW [Sulfobacillus thermosulfidooxidans]
MTFHDLRWDSAEEKELFVAELQDLLQTLEDTALSDDPDIAAAFRAAHTIKGSAAMVGLVEWSTKAHQLEDELDHVRGQDITWDQSDLRQQVLDLVDFIRGELSSSSPSSNLSPGEHWRIRLDPACALKGARAFQLLNRIQEVAEIVSSTPSLENPAELEQFDDTTVEVVMKIKTGGPVNWPELFHSVPEVESWEKVVPKEPDRSASLTVTPGGASTTRQENMIRIHPGVLEGLLDGLGELLLRHAELTHRLPDVSSSAKEALEGIKRIAMNLQDITLRARMLPLSTLFHQYPRAVHDIATQLSKDITLSIEGGETQLDRLVMDRLHEPLLHLIRNAADHGIESAEERLRQHKPPTGHIFLKASSRKGRVQIIVADDGHGIDWDRLREKAVKRGVMTREQAESALPDQLVAMLFLPGFSTKDQVSDLSGRGVGLDVVKETLTALHGDIRVESEPGQGTRFIMELPMTMAILSALLIQVGPVVLGIPVLNVERIEHWQQDVVKHTLGAEMIDDNGHPLKVTVLADWLKIPGSRPQVIVRVQDGPLKMALVADTVLGQQDVVIKPIDRVMPFMSWMTGAAVLGDGRVALMVDVKRLVERIGYDEKTSLQQKTVVSEGSTPEAISSWLVFELGAQPYAVSVEKVQEVLVRQPVSRIMGQHPFLEGVTMIRGESYPVISGRKMMDSPQDGESGYFIIIHMSQRRFVLSVDAVKEIIPINWRIIQAVPHYQKTEVIMGLAEVGDRVIQLVDFDATLAAVLPVDTSLPPAQEGPSRLDGVRVFVADDSRLARQKLMTALTEQGALVRAFEDGQALMTAIEEMKDASLRPHVVVTDMEMPRMDGYHVLQAMKSGFPAIPVIVHTSLDGKLSKERCQDLGADFVLTKWDVAELVHSVHLAYHGTMDNKGEKTHALIAD